MTPARRALLILCVASGSLLALGAPAALATAPDTYRSVYTADNSGGISEFNIDSANGSLYAKSTPSVGSGVHPQPGMTMSPDGKSLYEADNNGNIFQFDVDPTTGELSAKSPLTVYEGTSGAGWVAASPDGKYLYAAAGNGSILEYSIDAADGTLHSIGSVSNGNGVCAIATSPKGHLYAANWAASSVTAYDINNDGTLTQNGSPSADRTSPSQ